jgi:endoglucanase
VLKVEFAVNFRTMAIGVVGNQLLNGSNAPVRLLGVNRSGPEFACIQNNGIFDGPSDAASIQQILNWKANAIRIPLNEDCWLDVNTAGINRAYVGAAYRQAITDYVNLITNMGAVAIVELHWSAPGTNRATYLAPMPDADHSPDFWTSVANTFKNNSAVVFDLFNEPFPDGNSDTAAAWSCWRNGGMCAWYNGSVYDVAGFQSLVTTVRNTGATNVIMIGGVQYSNGLSGWLANKPNDPTGNLAASWHIYNDGWCRDVACWNQKVAPVAAQVPLITGEIGEYDCAYWFIEQVMSYLDTLNASYLGWTWNTWGCGGGPSLIKDYSGTPTDFGIGFKNHLAGIVNPPPPATTTVPVSTSIASTTTSPATTTTGWPSGTSTSMASTTTSGAPTTTVVTTTSLGGSTTTIAGGGGLRARVQNGGTDSTQQSQFHVQLANLGTTAATGMSYRIYFTLDGSQAVSKYVFDKYWDESNAAVVSGPILDSGSTYYLTVSFGPASLAAGGSWQLHGSLHLSDWSNNQTAANDFWHTGYSVGGLPANYTDSGFIPVFVGANKVWGSTPTVNPPTTTTLAATTTTNAATTTTRPATTTTRPATTTTRPATTTTRPATTTTVGATTTTKPASTTTVTSTGSIRTRIQNGGTDSAQQSQFHVQLANLGATARSNLSYRLYFTLDGGQAISKYVFEKYWDESGVATVTGPTLASGSTYYLTIGFGAKSLPSGGSWQLHGSLHLSDWTNNFSAGNDTWHGGYAVGSLPVNYTDTANIPVFVGATKVWG